jgi:hypothetical protein
MIELDLSKFDANFSGKFPPIFQEKLSKKEISLPIKNKIIHKNVHFYHRTPFLFPTSKKKELTKNFYRKFDLSARKAEMDLETYGKGIKFFLYHPDWMQ